jgi:PPM family protein phosphatase
MSDQLQLADGSASLRLRYAARSDVGLVRQGNEDSGFAGPDLLLVADGMGGHAAGELASATAVATIASVHPSNDETSAMDELAECVNEIGDRIAATIADEPELTGMGTTLTGIVWLGARIGIVHVGDSRAYRLRDGELAQLTHDHTYVQTLIDAGRITEDEAAVHPRRSLLMRALDGMNEVEADLFVLDAAAGDRLLLCSDGLSGVVSSSEIAAHLRVGDPTGCVTRLVDLALERGAPDNVTVIVADVISQESATPLPRPVVVGAAGETRVRVRLPHVRFPDDMQPVRDAPDAPPAVSGPPTAEQPLIDADVRVPAAEHARRQAAADAVAVEKRERNRRRWIVAGGITLAVVVLALAVLGLVRAFVSSQWYVAVNGSPGTGTVAVYQGVPGTLVGIPLAEVTSDAGITVGSLPLFDQELVSKGIPAQSQTDAERIVNELRARAASCQVALPPAGCPGTTP